MNLKEYTELYDGAPLSSEEFAEGATELTDAPELQEAGRAYLEALAAFHEVLEQHGVFFG